MMTEKQKKQEINAITKHLIDLVKGIKDEKKANAVFYGEWEKMYFNKKPSEFTKEDLDTIIQTIQRIDKRIIAPDKANAT